MIGNLSKTSVENIDAGVRTQKMNSVSTQKPLTNRQAFERILAKKGARPLKPSVPHRHFTLQDAMFAVSTTVSVGSAVAMFVLFGMAKKNRDSEKEEQRATSSTAAFKAMAVSIASLVIALLAKP